MNWDTIYEHCLHEICVAIKILSQTTVIYDG